MKKEKKYITIKKATEILGISAQTLRNWEKQNKLIPHHKTNSGFRYYTEEQINEILLPNNFTKQRLTIGYCRVSSNKQKDDLDRQVENMKIYLNAKDCPYEIITDIGSGINYTKKGLRELLQKIKKGQVEKIVVLYKDRLVRFGFELIEYIARLYNCEIEIVDNTEKTEQQELVEDLIQIITVFSCKLQGKRANKTRKMVEELSSEVKEDD